MKITKFAIALLVAAAPFAMAEAPDVDGARIGQWTMDLDAATKLAADQNVPIFLNFTGSDWCGWCKLMDKNVFSQAEWAGYATQSLVLVWIDFPKDASLVPDRYRERNKALSDKYQVEGYPTYVVLDSDGRTVLGRLGADRGMTPARFIQKLEAVVGNRRSAVEAMATAMGPEKGAEFRKQVERLAAARAEQAELRAATEANQEKLEAEIAALEKNISAARDEFLLSKLTDEQRTTYAAAKKAYDEQAKALKDWIDSDPERSPENQQKFESMSKQLMELDAARAAALHGG